MAAHSDEQLTLARVYAAAMAEAARDKDALASLGEELRDFVAFLDAQPDIWGYLSSPTIDAERRRETLEKMLRGKASETFVDSLQVLNRKGRMAILPALAHAFGEIQEAAAGRARQVDVR